MRLRSLAVAAAAAVLLAAAAVSCGGPDASSVIVARPAGAISAQAPLRVRFNEALAQPADVGKAAPERFVELAPGPGAAGVWRSATELEIIPHAPLRPGQEYRVRLRLDRLGAGRRGTARFAFSTVVPRLDAALEQVDLAGDDAVTAVVALTATDAVDPAALAAALSAHVDGRRLPVRLEAASARRFLAYVDSLPRLAARQTLTVECRAEAAGARGGGSVAVVVPARGEVAVIGHTPVVDAQAPVVVSLSQAVDARQDLEGMATLGQGAAAQVVAEGNKLRVYPEGRVTGPRTLTLRQGIRTRGGGALPCDWPLEVLFVDNKPAVRPASDKIFAPPAGSGNYFEFEATRLRAVDLRVVQVFADNLMQFLQDDNYGYTWISDRVGRVVHQQTVSLEGMELSSHDGWGRYRLDLSPMVRREAGAMYQIQVGFRRGQAILGCGDADIDNETDAAADPERYWASFDDWSYHHDWSDDPCQPGYYGFRRGFKQNYVATNIGLIAKRDAGGRLTVYATATDRAAPRSGCQVAIYNLQRQKMMASVTDRQGRALFDDPHGDALFVVADDGGDRCCIKLSPYDKLPMAHFDVEGSESQGGLRAYLFTERGVYRPGDTIHVGVVLHDPAAQLPEGHPISVRVTDARAQARHQATLRHDGGAMYALAVPTAADAPTGAWNVEVTVGKRAFAHRVMVETVRPNRMEITAELPATAASRTAVADIGVAWLHGAKAGRQLFKAEASARVKTLSFSEFPGFSFNAPASGDSHNAWLAFDGALDAQGRARVALALPQGLRQPAYAVTLAMRAFEPNGQFSSATAATVMSPYAYLVGARLPEPDGDWGQFRPRVPHTLRLAAATLEGRPRASSAKVRVQVLRRDWSWWYQRDRNSWDYVADQSSRPVVDQEVRLRDGAGQIDITLDDDWGYYEVRVTNLDNGQTAALPLNVGDDGYSGPKAGKEAAMLGVSADRASYAAGDEISLTFPSDAGGMALVSVESGRGVLRSEWVPTADGYTTYKLTADRAFSPNVYASVILLNDYASTAAGRPVRLYGVCRIRVTDPASRLDPRIECPAEARAGQPFTVEVSEGAGAGCQYMLAVVDEGLLGLTAHPTPAPWAFFNRDERLSVDTWDLAGWIMGALPDAGGRVIGIGGDGQAAPDIDPGALNSQFAPVVRVAGPFDLKPRGRASHTFDFPGYIGAVRVMAVAAAPGAWGSADRRVVVASPLMAALSLPRSLVPGDSFDMAVNIFGSGVAGQRVTVEARGEGGVDIAARSLAVDLDASGRGVCRVRCRALDGHATARVTVDVAAGGHQARAEAQLAVANPAPAVYDTDQATVPPGGSWRPREAGLAQGAWVELSAMPAMDLARHLADIDANTHAGVDARASAGFAALLAPKLLAMSDGRKADAAARVAEAIQRVAGHMSPAGMLARWPGGSHVDPWADLLGGDLLVEASAAGYPVDAGTLSRWVAAQRKAASGWVDTDPLGRQCQAYRLWALSRAGKADLGAMNRLRAAAALEPEAAALLALAYAGEGRGKAAADLLAAASAAADWHAWAHTGGSEARSAAIRALAALATGDAEAARANLESVAAELSSGLWHSPQSVAWAFRAAAAYAAKNGASTAVEATVSAGGDLREARADKAAARLDIPAGAPDVEVRNLGESALHARLVAWRRPSPAEGVEGRAGRMSVSAWLIDTDGQGVDPLAVRVGQDLVAVVSVSLPAVEAPVADAALTFSAPAGFELMDARLADVDESPYDYRDTRDNRAVTYFGLRPGETRVFRFALSAAFAGDFYWAPAQASSAGDPAGASWTQSLRVAISH